MWNCIIEHPSNFLIQPLPNSPNVTPTTVSVPPHWSNSPPRAVHVKIICNSSNSNRLSPSSSSNNSNRSPRPLPPLLLPLKPPPLRQPPHQPHRAARHRAHNRPVSQTRQTATQTAHLHSCRRDARCQTTRTNSIRFSNKPLNTSIVCNSLPNLKWRISCIKWNKTTPMRWMHWTSLTRQAASIPSHRPTHSTMRHPRHQSTPSPRRASASHPSTTAPAPCLICRPTCRQCPRPPHPPRARTDAQRQNRKCRPRQTWARFRPKIWSTSRRRPRLRRSWWTRWTSSANPTFRIALPQWAVCSD